MRFSERLRSLGYESYEAYLASPHWQTFKASYRVSGLPLVCAVCGLKPVQLHHHTYERLGAERLGDVTPLCRLHHEAVHAVLKDKRWLVERTKKVIRLLRRSPALQPPMSVKKKKKSKAERRKARKARLARRKVRKAEKRSLPQEARDHIDRANARTGHSPNGPPKHSNRRPARYSEPVIPGNWNDPAEAMKMLARGLRPPR